MRTPQAAEQDTATRDRLLPASESGDVHLRIWLGDTAFDYTAKAAAAAANNLIRDWRRRPWYAIELIQHTHDDRLSLPRLPNERLFLDA